MYVSKFWLDALAIFRVKMETSDETDYFIAARGWTWSINYGLYSRCSYVILRRSEVHQCRAHTQKRVQY